jgi:hypothetical protein
MANQNYKYVVATSINQITQKCTHVCTVHSVGGILHCERTNEYEVVYAIFPTVFLLLIYYCWLEINKNINKIDAFVYFM